MSNVLKNRLPGKISGISSPVLTKLNGKTFGVFIRRKGVEMVELPADTSYDDLLMHHSHIRLEKGEKAPQEWLIESQTSNHAYKVIFFNNRFYCTCPGHVAHGTDCKHIKSVMRRMKQIEAAKKAPKKADPKKADPKKAKPSKKK